MMKRVLVRPALRIALIYLIISLFWIISSDRIVGWLFTDINILNFVQSIKGMAFVFSTAVLLGWLLHVELKKQADARQRAENFNEDLDKRNRELTTLHQVGTALDAAHDLPQIYDIMFREIAQELLNVPHFVVALYDQEAGILECKYVVVDGTPRDPATLPPCSLDDGPLSQTIRLRQCRIVDVMSLKRHGITPEIHIDDQRASQVALYIPLLSGDKVVGMTLFLHYEQGAFDNINIQFVLTLAHQVAVVLDNAILLDQVRRHADDLEKKVSERTAELTQANDHLKQLDRLKSKFVADVTHDLRGPVASMLMRVDLLERITPDKVDQYIRDLKDQVLALKNLVDDVLDISQLDVTQMSRLTLQPVDVNALVEQVVVTYEPISQNAGLIIDFAPGHDLPPVWGEGNQLSRMVSNLVTNAINYTREGRVRVSTGINSNREMPGRRICIKVADTGVGIEPADLPHLFDRFYRGNKTAKNTPGSGLGLSIVKEIVDLHRGEIVVTSQLGKGSTFVIYLPVPDFLTPPQVNPAGDSSTP